MGLPPFNRSSYSSYDKPTFKVYEGNPNPKIFHLVRSKAVGDSLILLVRYPNCFNYEGLKILVYDSRDAYKLLEQNSMDPHFSNNKSFTSPIARFEPTDRGWEMAVCFAKNWSNK